VPVRMGAGTWKALSHRGERGQIAGSGTPPDPGRVAFVKQRRGAHS
jgi:hypothetical protein